LQLLKCLDPFDVNLIQLTIEMTWRLCAFRAGFPDVSSSTIVCTTSNAVPDPLQISLADCNSSIEFDIGGGREYLERLLISGASTELVLIFFACHPI
jgi:hypothetical protein